MAFPDGWQYRCPIVIDADQVDDTLTDWPLLLTEANLPAEIFSDANADGSDIRASSDQDGTAELAVQVVSFVPGSSAAQVWVQVPTVSAVADTTIYIWFGNAAATMPAADSAFGREAVWNSSFASVWHLEESGNGTVGEYLDSTANDNDGQGGAGSAPAVPTQATGQLTKGQSLDGGDFIATANASLLNGASGVTYSLWINASVPTVSWTGILMARSTTNNGLSLAEVGNPTVYLWVNGTALAAQNPLSTGTWVHVAATWETAGNAARIYINGTQNKQGTIDKTTISQDDVFKIGFDDVVSNRKFLGSLDELRIASTNLSAAWISADYRSQSAPGTFASAGAVEVLSTTTPVADILGRWGSIVQSRIVRGLLAC